MVAASRTCESCRTPVPVNAAFCPTCGTATPTQVADFTQQLPLRLATTLADRYRIERELGRGGMAIVYLAHDLRHDRQVAIKVLRPELAAAIGTDRFAREIKLAARLNHPHILTLHDSGEIDGLRYYVMPYVEGESLRHRLQRERQLPIGEALRLTQEIAEGLAYAHERGVIHRDIKPENILLSRGHALIADFGIAKAVAGGAASGLTSAGTSIGTPLYMSPEQAAGDPQVDGRADVYSLGCALYEMLAGEPPFTGPTVPAIMAKHALNTRPSVRVVRDTVPPEVDRAIQRAMAKSAADRPASAAAFAAALRAPAEGPHAGPRVAGGGRVLRIAGLGIGAVVLVLAVTIPYLHRLDTGRESAATGEPVLAALMLTPAVHALELGDTVGLTPLGTTPSGDTLSPQRVRWTSSDPAVARVTSAGVVYAEGTGTAVVRGTVGGLGVSATILVQSLGGARVSAIVIRDAPDSLSVGTTSHLRAVLQDEAGSPLGGVAVFWWSSDTSVATVDSAGTLEARRPGTAAVGAAAGRLLSTVPVVVTSPVRSVASITLLPRTPLPLQVHERLQLTARALAADGEPVAEAPLRWTSDDGTVATVTDGGLVTAVTPGTATIAVTSDPISRSVRVTVQPILVQPQSIQEAIPVLMRQYGLALESRDPGLLRQIWPTITDRTTQQLLGPFAAMRDLSVVVAIDSVMPAGDSVAVQTVVTYQFRGSAGGPMSHLTAPVRFVVARRGETWQIVDAH